MKGCPVGVSEREGGTTWQARGMTFVQIAIPPARSRQESLFVVTCRYAAGVSRPRWEVAAAIGRAQHRGGVQ